MLTLIIFIHQRDWIERVIGLMTFIQYNSALKNLTGPFETAYSMSWYLISISTCFIQVLKEYVLNCQISLSINAIHHVYVIM